MLRSLGVTENDIQDVSALNRNRKPAEMVYRGLLRWEELCCGEASMDVLITALRNLHLDEAAGKLQ